MFFCASHSATRGPTPFTNLTSVWRSSTFSIIQREGLPLMTQMTLITLIRKGKMSLTYQCDQCPSVSSVVNNLRAFARLRVSHEPYCVLWYFISYSLPSTALVLNRYSVSTQDRPPSLVSCSARMNPFSPGLPLV